ncbi:hypothetical protein QBC37DRAFT_158488 [Rhypophila decipiens]|uniref:CCHC-type domain-containing protein n=1 Tax=Rhypophila decipiens TaxID=261697 RepID=A0AAN6XSA6_9PEZI|nr:hypothetical protein QBC37DRAFT_158488 [Rhypophila decipiens]
MSQQDSPLSSLGTHTPSDYAPTQTLLQRIPRMSIDDLVNLLDHEDLGADSDELRLIKQRIEQFQLRASLQGIKRSLEDSSNSEPSKRQRHEFKYTNIDKLTPTASLRKLADWKADMSRLFEGSPSKFETDSMKLIAAHQYMDDKAKTLWQTHVHTTPDDNNWPDFLQWAQRLVSQGSDSQVTIYQDYYKANQREGQSPTTFDAYLSSLESVMGEHSQVSNAMNFFTRLLPELQVKMELSGRERFPETRQEMVSFAQRIWHGMVKAGAVKIRKERSDNKKKEDPKDPSQQEHPGQGRSNQGHGQRGRGGRSGRGEGPTSSRQTENKFPTGQNDKGEPCCFKCGSTDHFVAKCDNSGPSQGKDSKPQSTPRPQLTQKTPRVNQTRVKEYEDLTSSSDSEN